MQHMIVLSPGDGAHGTSGSLVFFGQTDQVAIELPTDPAERLRICAEIADALEELRAGAYRSL